MNAATAPGPAVQMCTATDLLGGPECLRIAQWTWRSDNEAHPLFLCNFHAEPLDILPERAP